MQTWTLSWVGAVRCKDVNGDIACFWEVTPHRDMRDMGPEWLRGFASVPRGEGHEVDLAFTDCGRFIVGMRSDDTIKMETAGEAYRTRGHACGCVPEVDEDEDGGDLDSMCGACFSGAHEDGEEEDLAHMLEWEGLYKRRILTRIGHYAHDRFAIEID